MSIAQKLRLFVLGLVTVFLYFQSGVAQANTSLTPSPKATDPLWPCIGAAPWVYTLWNDDGSVRAGFPESRPATVACEPPHPVGPWGEVTYDDTYPGCVLHTSFTGLDPLALLNSVIDTVRAQNTCMYLADSISRRDLGLEPIYQWGEACTSAAANSALIFPYYKAENIEKPYFDLENKGMEFHIRNIQFPSSLPYCGGKVPLVKTLTSEHYLFAKFACPIGTHPLNIPVGVGTCVPDVTPPPPSSECDLIGKPVNVSTGYQDEIVTDYGGKNGLLFFRKYSSGAPSHGNTLPWGSTIELSKVIGVMNASGTRYSAFAVVAYDGSQQAYTLHDDNSLTPVMGNVQPKLALLTQTAATANAMIMDSVPSGTTIYITGFTLTSPDGSFDQYDYLGTLVSRTAADNSKQFFTYSGAGAYRNLATLSDFTGRALKFAYNSRNQLVEMKDPANGVYQYEYSVDAENRDGSRLNKVIYPDLTSIGYTYVAGTNNLSSIIDQNGAAYNTMLYNANDDPFQSVSSQLIGGVDGFTFTYSRYGGTYFDPDILHVDITDSLGNTTVRWYEKIKGVRRLTKQSQPAGSGCAAATARVTYTAAGKRSSSDDFNGGRTCYLSSSADAARELHTSIVEGLSNANTCGATLDAHSFAGTGRATTLQWHPDAAIPVKVAAPRRVSLSIYNGQPDPTNGNALASCMPGTLPNGKAPMVLCKTVVMATTDLTGAAGLNAGIDQTVQAVVSSLTYNADGQVLTSKDAGGAVTQFAYYPATDVGHTKGDLASTTNAKLQVTTFDSYNLHGDILQSTAANGLVTVMTYDSMRRLRTATAGGLTETYTYKPFGAIATRTAPNGGITTYDYDPAHRLVSVTDASGNVHTKTLNNAGGVTNETVQDAQGTIARSVTRVFDALHRVKQVTGVQ